MSKSKETPDETPAPESEASPEPAGESRADKRKRKKTPVAVEAERPAFTGEMLKKAREAKGLSIVEISDRTKISKAVLAALEEERYEDMPNARVYVRGFIRCVARELDLEPDTVSKSYVPRWEKWFEANQP